MKHLFFTCVLIITFASVQVWANPQGWHSNLKIERLNMTRHYSHHGDGEHGGLFVVFDKSYSNTICGESNRKTFFFNVKKQREKSWYAMVMMAYATGSSVNVYVENMCGAYNYPVIGEIQVHKGQ